MIYGEGKQYRYHADERIPDAVRVEIEGDPTWFTAQAQCIEYLADHYGIEPTENQAEEVRRWKAHEAGLDNPTE